MKLRRTLDREGTAPCTPAGASCSHHPFRASRRALHVAAIARARGPLSILAVATLGSGLAGAAACRAPTATTPAPADTDGAAAARADDGAHRRVYAISLEGAHIGYSFDEERRRPAPAGSAVGDHGRELRRREVVRFRRGAELVTLETELAITGTAQTGAQLVTVEVRHCVGDASRGAPPASWRVTAAPLCPATPPAGETSGPLAYRGRAERTPTGWLQRDDAGVRMLPPSAQPAEWIDLDGPPRAAPDEARHDEPTRVFFPARRFASGFAILRWIDERTWSGEALLEGARLSSSTAMASDGRPSLTLDNTGGMAQRVAETELARELALVDLVALTSLAIEGPPPPLGAPPRFFVSLPAAAAAPPPAAGQRVTVEAAGWRVELVLPPRAAEAERATVATATAIASQLADETRVFATHAPLPAEGDCTTRALRFVSEVRRRGFRARLVTGLRLDERLLVRHRWAEVWTGARWLAVDPTFAPSASDDDDDDAPPDLFALAVHDTTAAALAGAETAFAALRGARLRWLP